MLAATKVASSATATAGSSAAGSAWARLPQTVPLARMGGWAIHGRAAASSGQRAPTAGDRSARDWRTMAPITRPAGVSSRLPSAASRPMSITCPGRASRKFSSGTRLCPPASTLASSVWLASSVSAASTVAG